MKKKFQSKKIEELKFGFDKKALGCSGGGCSPIKSCGSWSGYTRPC